ncbi:MAG: hypothetical protein NTY53_10580 [Kiritimatiellaeota bacterium]|nr:hypothetical protein [Kiritimatiellota bacterium]
MQVTDAKVRDALTVLDLCEALRIGDVVRVDAIHVAHPDNLDIRLATGERVPMARTQLDDRLRKLVATKKALAERHQVASVIDCSLSRNVPVTLVPPMLPGATN